MVKIYGCLYCVRICKRISIVFDPLWIISLYYLSVEELTLCMSVSYLLQHVRHFWTLFGSRSLKFPDFYHEGTETHKQSVVEKGFIV